MINGVRVVLTAAQTQTVLDALYGKITKTPKVTKPVAKKRKGFFAKRYSESETADIARIAMLKGKFRSQAIKDFARQSGRTKHAVALRVYQKSRELARQPEPEIEYAI